MFSSIGNRKRHCSHAENLPPHKNRFDPISRRRRGIQSKYNLAQAKRRSEKKAVRVNVACPATKTVDIQMADGETKPVTKPAGRVNVPVQLPRALGQPSYVEVNPESLRAAFGSHSFSPDIPAEFIRDQYEENGMSLLKTVSTISADVPKDKLPTEVDVLIHDNAARDLPTHMLAVYGAEKVTPPKKMEIKLYPIHAPLMAAYCAKLPAFGPSPITEGPVPEPTTNGTPRKVTLPVRNLRLPHPKTFAYLSQYMYTHRAEILYNAFLPFPPTKCAQAFHAAGAKLSEDDTPLSFFTHPQSTQHQIEVATELAATYTAHRLLESVAVVHGTWMNACALGVFDEKLWTVIDGCWEVLLRALAIGAGVEIED
ncbi:hypothetical protein V5O48_005856 [Marasmius crinis-equi]|uniref:Clp1-like protein n=1 Tax=Marasmius crinis-equi TaxID=585013 RepID=A0ABR3FL31_9AGAR